MNRTRDFVAAAVSGRRWLCAGAATMVLVAAACAPRYLMSTPQHVGNLVPPATSVSRHVIVISIDGLRPDALGRDETPTLHRLMTSGSYSLAASTILPSNTLPSHTSMLTGEPPERHGVSWNNVPAAKFDVVEVPTIFSVAKARGYSTAAFFSKSKFHTLQRPGTLDYSQAPGGWFGKWSSARTVADLQKHLSAARPNLLFVHLSDPDSAGHDQGWMTLAYRRAVKVADDAVGRVLVEADGAYGAGNYALIVSADHGGHGRGHGTDDPLDVTIPWIVWGRGVKPGKLESSVRTMDTASTALWLLGLEEPTDWMGRPVLEAFHGPATAGVRAPAASAALP